MTNYCSQCGQPVRNGSQFCSNCGTAIVVGSKRRKRKKRDWGALVTGIGAAFTLFTAVFFFLTGRDNIAPPQLTDEDGVVVTVVVVAPQDVPDSEPTPEPLALPDEPVAVPANLPATGCPIVDGMIWLQFSDLYYPFRNGDSVGFDSFGNVRVWDADMLNVFGGFGAEIPYYGLYYDAQPNIWNSLTQSVFQVCVDSNGLVFATDG